MSDSPLRCQFFNLLIYRSICFNVFFNKGNDITTCISLVIDTGCNIHYLKVFIRNIKRNLCTWFSFGSASIRSFFLGRCLRGCSLCIGLFFGLFRLGLNFRFLVCCSGYEGFCCGLCGFLYLDPLLFASSSFVISYTSFKSSSIKSL